MIKSRFIPRLLVITMLGLVMIAPTWGQGRSEGGSKRRPMPTQSGPSPHDQRTQGVIHPGAGKGASARRIETERAPKELAEHLAQHPRLESKVEQLLPPGSKVSEEAQGFKNLGQFVAAAHVSKNLNIPFGDLKAQMLGPADGSLGRAIRTLKPDLDPDTVKREVKQAKKQARENLKNSEPEADEASRRTKGSEKSNARVRTSK